MIVTQICKEAAVRSSGTPDERQLAKINTFSKSPLTAQEVYCFSVRLCDDLPDRDFECFDTAALPELAALFRGKTGIVDHDWSAERQIARIYDTEVLTEDGCSLICAHCYMLRTDKNADLIADIEGGIRKEVSVGCAMQTATCSICGSVYGACEHRKGVCYDGKTCLAVLSEPTDAYEFSFVAVPAQREAGVLKAKKGGVCMTLREFVEKSGTPEFCDRLKELEAEADFGKQCRQSELTELISLALLLDFGADEAILRKCFEPLGAQELHELKRAMAQKAAELYPPKAQLPKANGGQTAMESAFLI